MTHPSFVDSLTTFEFGTFRLDGGAMFGSVPKNLWSKRIAADPENCIALTTRSLLIRTAGRLIVVDAGMGEHWTPKEREIFAIKNLTCSAWPFDPIAVTDLILTHLHFDHAGGISQPLNDSEPVATFPNALIHLQNANWENAHAPTLKERASYRSTEVKFLKQARVNLINDSCEIAPGVVVHRVDGHTVGQQWLEIHTAQNTYMFLTDVVPTSHHVTLPYHMGYDACATTLLKEKNEILSQAVARNCITIFEHDAEVAAARIERDAKGGFCVCEKVTL